MSGVPAVVMLGPTGSGKTPLGILLEKTGFKGWFCHHFDFGEIIRRSARGKFPAILSEEELCVVRTSLETGTLLEDGDFGIVRKLLEFFINSRPAKNRLILMNGMPRHIGQLQALTGSLDVKLVVLLECSSDVVRKRIRLDAGGDRAGRVDDSIDMVEEKLKLYRERTAPLLDFYQKLGVRLAVVSVEETMTAEKVREALEAELKEGL